MKTFNVYMTMIESSNTPEILLNFNNDEFDAHLIQIYKDGKMLQFVESMPYNIIELLSKNLSEWKDSKSRDDVTYWTSKFLYKDVYNEAVSEFKKYANMVGWRGMGYRLYMFSRIRASNIVLLQHLRDVIYNMGGCFDCEHKHVDWDTFVYSLTYNECVMFGKAVDGTITLRKKWYTIWNEDPNDTIRDDKIKRKIKESMRNVDSDVRRQFCHILDDLINNAVENRVVLT